MRRRFNNRVYKGWCNLVVEVPICPMAQELLLALIMSSRYLTICKTLPSHIFVPLPVAQLCGQVLSSPVYYPENSQSPGAGSVGRSSVKYLVSSILYPVSVIQYRLSSIKPPVSISIAARFSGKYPRYWPKRIRH